MPQFFMSIAHHATTHKNFGLAPQIITTDAAVVSVWLQFIKTIDIMKYWDYCLPKMFLDGQLTHYVVRVAKNRVQRVYHG